MRKSIILIRGDVIYFIKPNEMKGKEMYLRMITKTAIECASNAYRRILSIFFILGSGLLACAAFAAEPM